MPHPGKKIRFFYSEGKNRDHFIACDMRKGLGYIEHYKKSQCFEMFGIVIHENSSGGGHGFYGNALDDAFSHIFEYLPKIDIL